jgi:hypothetical protein
MKLFPARARLTGGHMLLIASVMVSVGLVAASGIYLYSMANMRQNERNNDYYLGVAASEAATEKVLSAVVTDFRNYGIGYVVQQLPNYRTSIPTASESSVWTNFTFTDLSGQANHIEVDYTSLPGFLPLAGQYGPLRATKDRLRILANAQPSQSLDGVVGSVYQDIELTSIPIFQYAVFYNVPLEFTPVPNMVITGPVHCNTNIYLNPYGVLTFNNDITSSGTIIEGPNPVSPLPALGGSIVYLGAHDSGLSTLSLPIGTNNSPAAVHQVLELPPGTLPAGSESATSSLGLQRYYNKADLVIIVSNATVSARSGRWNNFATVLGTNDYSVFLSTNASFYNKRENKTVQAIQIDVSKLVQWNATNGTIRPSLPLHDVRVIYVADARTFAAGNESGVRVVNGVTLPPQGLTLATPAPLYVQGNYNVPASALGTTNTSGTVPASFASDAVTVLSTNWNDANSTLALSLRVAGNTTVNAAFLTGIVGSCAASDSGGVENIPRFLEDWSTVSKTFTYNGSIVCMFYSQVATNYWINMGAAPSGPDIYNPPVRNWALDQNYQTETKLPPATPSLAILSRANWRTPAAYTTNVLAGY